MFLPLFRLYPARVMMYLEAFVGKLAYQEKDAGRASETKSHQDESVRDGFCFILSDISPQPSDIFCDICAICAT